MKAWFWILIMFLGSLPIGHALQYYFADEPFRNTPTRNWLAVGEAALGVLIMAFGLYRQVKSARQIPEPDDRDELKITDD